MYKILTVLILVSLTGITSISYAQQGYRSQAGPAERGRLLPGIPDLTEEQKEQIKNLQTAYLKDIQELKNEMKINKAKLDALLTEDQPNMNEINMLLEDNGKMLTELRKKQIAHKMEIRDLLTEEQKIIFDNRTLRNDIRPYRYNYRSFRYDNRPYRDARIARRNHPYRHWW